jgi:hypothetical protein
MEYTGLIFDDSRHYIDHLAPFCSQIGWPLIVCEPEIAVLCRKLYPDLQLIEEPLLDLKLPPGIVSCDPVPIIQAAFPHQETKVFWLPHGNSDKGWNSPFFQGVGDTAFVYGQKMIDFMHAKSVFPKTIRVGNFRYEYFLKHRAFYENLYPEIPILYAPTWEDSEKNGTFWSAFPYLIEKFPHLAVKLHPNTIRKFEVELEILKGRYPNLFVDEIPPIYPLLSRCRELICDTSSIGYDFLTFDRPVHFIHPNPHLPLHQCTTSITRQKMASYTFDAPPDWNQVRKEIDCALSH